MKMKTLLASMAVAGLAVAQPASAATRSADSLPQGSVNADTADRIGSIVGESEDVRGRPVIVIAIIFLVVGGLILALSGDKGPVSP